MSANKMITFDCTDNLSHTFSLAWWLIMLSRNI